MQEDPEDEVRRGRRSKGGQDRMFAWPPSTNELGGRSFQHMPDLPHPFERGIELPGGSKDLYEAMQKAGSQKKISHGGFAIERGTLANVPTYVQQLYLEPTGVVLAIIVLEREGILWASHLEH